MIIAVIVLNSVHCDISGNAMPTETTGNINALEKFKREIRLSSV